MELDLQHQKLGIFTFWIFVIESSVVAVTGFFGFVISVILKVTNFSTLFLESSVDLVHSIDLIINWMLLGSLGLTAVGIVLAFILGTIDYFTYGFVLDENALRIKRGILNVQEISIPYRHIQDVNIERPILYQILGASRLVILTAGNNDNDNEEFKNESVGSLPAIHKEVAEALRTDLLRRTGTQKVVEVKSV